MLVSCASACALVVGELRKAEGEGLVKQRLGTRDSGVNVGTDQALISSELAMGMQREGVRGKEEPRLWYKRHVKVL